MNKGPKALLTNVNEDSIKDGKEIYVQVQATELAIFKEENLMPEELIYKPVTIDMKEKIKYLEMEVLQLKSDLQYLRELHKTNLRIMTNTCLENMQKVMNKVSGITANELQHEDILDDTEISINKPFSSRMKGCSSNAMDHLYCKDINIKVEPESDIDDTPNHSLPTDYIDQFQNSPVTLNTIKTEQQRPSSGLNISNIRTISGEISDDVIEYSTTMTPKSKSIINVKRKRTSADEENYKDKEVKSLKLDNIDHPNIIKEKTSMVSLDTSVTKPFVVVGEHYKQITQNTSKQLQNILNLSHLNMKKENIAINENMMTHKPIIFPVIIQKALPAGSQILRNELLKKDVIIRGSPLKTENMNMKNQVVFNVNSSPNKEQTEKGSYSASFQVKYHKICPKPSKDVDVSKLPECDICELRKHQLEHPSEKHETEPNVCPDCNERFDNAEACEKHIPVHLENLPYGCGTCGKSFSKTVHLQTHMAVHTKKSRFRCSTCSLVFFSGKSFTEHVKTHKDTVNMCDDCGQSFPDVRTLEDHIPEHSREDLLYGCGFCDKGFSKPSHLKYHMKKHEFDEEDGLSLMKECRNVDNQTMKG
ncbi:Hypothetical predicted protein [Mytilus galloprovincialis]|uniref:C2H2-type domain-containing protein n=1 Tax=Mytilus galloprovincialis TaxID=29158 RepID=A0A8B6CKY3_MYTGA|nr:Hypothetical predicted protein [Mytilus galloprovincialis]